MPIQAVQHIRRMRGGAQSHLMRCADGHYYVVKFQNNPQHTRVLVNDWLGTRLAELIGLPVPVADIVDVNPWLVEHSPELRIELCGRQTVVIPGLSFGSRYVVPPEEGEVHDYLPETMIGRVRNLNTSPACWRSTNGPAMRMVVRQRSGSGRENASSPRALSIRDTASMQGNGAFPMHRCVASSVEMMYTQVLPGGTALSLGSAGSRAFPKARYSRSSTRFLRSGTTLPWTSSIGCCANCWNAARWFVI